jgi:hypothetical protein
MYQALNSRTSSATSWLKRGLVFRATGRWPWSQSHSQLPTVDRVDSDTLRIYFGTRDSENRTVVSYVEASADDPSRVTYIHDKPVLGLGKLGAFDDSGAMPSWVIDCNGLKYLYYIGWNRGHTVPYRNSIGVAVSCNGRVSFTRLFEGPVMDRTRTEPHFCAAPCVLVENGVWRMWYLSCVKWELRNGRPEPHYHIKYAESADGIDWRREGTVAIDFKTPQEGGIVRASVLREGGVYKMWYSYRGWKNYRTDWDQSYRIGYAESGDGIGWKRLDHLAGIDVSESGWDSEMIAYPYVYRHGGQLYMLYNGNEFGRSGFGYAIAR